MSYDLAVFYTARPLTSQEAARIYHALCDIEPGDPKEVYKLVEPNDRMSAFVRELSELYPPLMDVPEEEIESTPWSCDHDISEGHILMSLRWSRSDTVGNAIIDRAFQYGLTIYDPQEDTVHLPPALSTAPDRRRNS